MAFNKLQRLADNILALETAFDLQRSGADPDLEQIRILSRYCGFGAIKEILRPIDQPELWDDIPKFYEPIRSLHELLLDNTDSMVHYREAVEHLKASVLTTFFTPPQIIEAVGSAFHTTGIRPLTVLDPAAGLGQFSSLFNELNPECEILNIEKNDISGMILSLLNPKSINRIGSFENLEPEFYGGFDMVATNVPFGNFRAFDGEFCQSKDKTVIDSMKLIHNYFLVKSIETCREGGLIALILPRGIMDRESNKELRKWVTEKTNVISAVRLPDETFLSYAGTETGTDILILQKDTLGKVKGIYNENFINTTTINGVRVNSLFEDDSRVICSEQKFSTNQFNEPVIKYSFNESTTLLADQLQLMMRADIARGFNHDIWNDNIPEYSVLQNYYGTFGSQQRRRPDDIPFTGEILPFYREGFMVATDDEVGTVSKLYRPVKRFTPLSLSQSDAVKAKQYIALRDLYYELYFYENGNLRAHDELRQRMRDSYHRFTFLFGDLNHASNRELLLLDTAGREMMSLERYKDDKKTLADIFTRPVAFFSEPITHMDDIRQAYALCLNKHGDLNINFLESITGKPWEHISQELSDKIFYDPIRDKYLIEERFFEGNLYNKIDAFEIFQQNNGSDPRIEASLKAMRERLPEPIPFTELDFNLGERWIPGTIYSDFATEIFKTRVEVNYVPEIDEFSITADGTHANIEELYAVTAEGVKYDGLKILQYAFMDIVPRFTKEVEQEGKTVRVPDFEKIQDARAKIDDIRIEFRNWLYRQSPDFQNVLADTYNKLFNNIYVHEYSGEHLDLSDLNLEGLGYKEVYPSQKSAVWKAFINDGALIDHKVGSGKTLIGCMLAHMHHRLQTHKKIIFSCIKANVSAVAHEYRTAYPNDRILFPTDEDFSPANRIRLFYDFMNNDWSLMICTHEQLEKIPLPQDIEVSVLQEIIGEIEDTISKAQGYSRTALRRLESQKNDIVAQIARIHYHNEKNKDNILNLRDMGVSHIIVDEAHKFKNIPYATRHSDVAGLNNRTGSNRALNMLEIIRMFQHDSGSDLKAVLMSGTLFDNSISEVYTWSKALRPGALKEMNIRSFDAWIATFGEKSFEIEVDVVGRVRMRERFREFIKIPELSSFLRQMSSYCDGVQLDCPQIKNVVKILDPTPEQVKFGHDLLKFAMTGNGSHIGIHRELTKDEQNAIMLMATNYASQMAIDVRLIDPLFYNDHPYNKINNCAAQVAETYWKYNEQKGTQLVFFDLGTFKKGQWNVASALKKCLVEKYGIPPQDIRYINEAINQKKKQEFEKDINEGEFRIGIGSTAKMGEGNNYQKKLCQLHDLDISWKFTIHRQRKGRAERPGNDLAKNLLDNTIEHYYYVTRNTIDNTKLATCHYKETMWKQLREGTISGIRRIDEGSFDEHTGMNLLEIAHALTGNNDLFKKTETETKIARLEREKNIFYDSRSKATQNLEKCTNEIERRRKLVEAMRKDHEEFIRAVESSPAASHGIVLDNFDTDELKSICKELRHIRNTYTSRNDYLKIGQAWGFDIVMKTTEVFSENPNRFYMRSKNNPGYHYQYNNGILAFSDEKMTAANFVKALETIPGLIEQQSTRVDKLEADLPTYQGIIDREWKKDPELKALKLEHTAISLRLTESMNKIQETIAAGSQANEVEDVDYTLIGEEIPRIKRSLN